VVRVSIQILIVASGLIAARAAATELPVETSGVTAIRPIRLVLPPTPPAAGPTFAPDRLRAELEAELGRPVRLGGPASLDADDLRVAFRAAGKELTVDYVPRSGTSVTRTVSVAETASDVTALAVLLAGNLARDQAAELLGPSPAPAADAEAAPVSAPADVKRVAAVPAERPPAARPVASTTAASTLTLESLTPAGLLDGIRVRAVVWAGTLSLMNVALRLSDQYAYGMLSASAHQKDGRRMFGPGLAFGARIPLRPVWCESDVGITYLQDLDKVIPASQAAYDAPSNYTNNRLITRVRSALVFSPFQDINLFAGVAFALTTHLTGDITNEWGPEVFAGFQL